MCRFTVILFVLWSIRITLGVQCPPHQDAAVKLAITSRRNSTGHWIAQVSLDHGAEKTEIGPWEVDVDHSVAKCKDQDLVHLVTTITAPKQHHHSDYQLLPGLGYYRFHDVPVTWYKAVLTCAQDNGHLLILNFPTEFTELKKIWDASGVKGQFLHLGINDFDNEEEFVTVLGDPVKSSGYVKWAPTQPRKDNTANCGAVRRTGDLDHSYCSNQYPFFCEQSLA